MYIPVTCTTLTFNAEIKRVLLSSDRRCLFDGWTKVFFGQLLVNKNQAVGDDDSGDDGGFRGCGE